MQDNSRQKQRRAVGVLEEGFTEFAKAMAEVMVEEQAHAGYMLPKATQQDKIANEIIADCVVLKRRLENGGRWLIKGLKEVQKSHPEIDLIQVNADLINVVAYLAALNEQQAESLQNQSLQEAVGLQNSTLEALYKSAKFLYEHQHYQEACDCFGLLTFLHPRQFVFWIGLGNSEYFCRRYKPALIAYAMAIEANPDDPSPLLYSAKCYEELRQIENAINALDIALFVIHGQPHLEALKVPIEQERARLTQKNKRKAGT